VPWCVQPKKPQDFATGKQPLSAKTRAEILIVGGGIGGVALALALARRGLRSRVLEKAPEFGEIGYGIQQGPNAYRVLDWLGVMKDLEPQAVFTKNLILIDALTDKELTRISCGDTFRRHFRAPYTVVHRRDLHGALLEACRKRDEIALHTSKELVSFDDRGRSVVARFADGSEIEGAALVGGEPDLVGQARQVDAGGHRRAALHVELQVLHRRDPVPAPLPLVEARGDPGAVLEQEVEVLGQSPPLPELDRANRRVLDLDEERGAELPGAAEQIVVGVELVLDVGLAHQAVEELASLRRLQVEGEATLVAMQQRDADPHGIGGRRHHEHVHAQVGQQHGAIGSGELPGEVEEAVAAERAGHGAPVDY